MHNVGSAFWVEALKAHRSRMPLFTLLGFSLAPLVGGFFMIILRDVEMARRIGLISMKAQIVAGTADWPTYLALLAQATAIGGFILFSLVISWVFGREFSDRTAKDLLALPTSRTVIVLAKFVVTGVWAGALVAAICLLGLGVGHAVALPPTPPGVIAQGLATVAITAALTIAVTMPIAFFAGAGRGYLPAMGAALLAVILAQIVAAVGWGDYFPWAIPALYAGAARPNYASLGIASYGITVATLLIGLAATLVWWESADQS